MYTLRNKRSIAHANEVDPNTVDLALAHQSAMWILAELIRNADSITMEEAGAAIDLLQVPVGTLVEEIDGTRLVHAELSIREELLILMHSAYPNPIALADLMRSMRARSAGGIKNQLAALRTDKLIVGDAEARIPPYPSRTRRRGRNRKALDGRVVGRAAVRDFTLSALYAATRTLRGYGACRFAFFSAARSEPPSAARSLATLRARRPRAEGPELAGSCFRRGGRSGPPGAIRPPLGPRTVTPEVTPRKSGRFGRAGISR